MNKFQVFEDNDFEKNATKFLSNSQLLQLEKIKDELVIKGEKVGKPLRFPHFREKRIGSKRIYFLVYIKYKIILLVGCSDKKTQQATIERILALLDEFNEFVEKEFSELA